MGADRDCVSRRLARDLQARLDCWSCVVENESTGRISPRSEQANTDMKMWRMRELETIKPTAADAWVRTRLKKTFP